MKDKIIIILKILILSYFISNYAFSNTVNKIDVTGNERISDETIKSFIDVKINNEIDKKKLNEILKDLYETNFFEDINVSFDNQILLINVTENPIIDNIFYLGIKSKRILKIIEDLSSIKARSSYNEKLIKKEKLKVENILKDLGYYKSNIDILVEIKKNNLVNLTYDINLGKKSKIKKISFVGDKVFKDKNYAE